MPVWYQPISRLRAVCLKLRTVSHHCVHWHRWTVHHWYRRLCYNSSQQSYECKCWTMCTRQDHAMSSEFRAVKHQPAPTPFRYSAPSCTTCVRSISSIQVVLPTSVCLTSSLKPNDNFTFICVHIRKAQFISIVRTPIRGRLFLLASDNLDGGNSQPNEK